MATYGGLNSKASDSIGPVAVPRFQPRATDEFSEFEFIGDGCNMPTNWRRGRHIGSGGFGKVYEVEDIPLHRNLAVKQVKGYEQERVKEKAALSSELERLKRLSHPRIVQLYGFCEAEGVLFLFMERIKGGSLDKYLKDESKQPLDGISIRSILRQMLEGVSYLHSKRILHRDIKSTNILMGEHLQIKLADFGVSKVFQDISKATTKPIGTTRWQAPEMFSPSNDYSYEVDIWAIGCTVVEMLTRKRPFHNLKEHDVRFKLMSPDPSPAHDLPETCPPKLRDFLNEVFQKDGLKRPSARDLLLSNPFVTGSNDEQVNLEAAMGLEFVKTMSAIPNSSQTVFIGQQQINIFNVIKKVKNVAAKEEKITAKGKSEKIKPEDEDKIRKNWSFLVEDLDGKEIAAAMFEADIFDLNDKREITEPESRKKRTETLLNKLLNAGPGPAFETFIKILERDHGHIAKKLAENV